MSCARRGASSRPSCMRSRRRRWCRCRTTTAVEDRARRTTSASPMATSSPGRTSGRSRPLLLGRGAIQSNQSKSLQMTVDIWKTKRLESRLNNCFQNLIKATLARFNKYPYNHYFCFPHRLHTRNTDMQTLPLVLPLLLFFCFKKFYYFSAYCKIDFVDLCHCCRCDFFNF